jgi:hypothetical protein
MTILPIGTICFLTHASVLSMTTYNTYKNKGLTLKCPCKIRLSDRLVVLDILSPQLALIGYYDNKQIISIVSWNDLKKV